MLALDQVEDSITLAPGQNIIDILANDLAGKAGASPNDFFRQDVNLFPAQALQESNRSAKYNRFDIRPKNCPLAHRARFGGCVECESLAVEIYLAVNKSINCVDFAMPGRIDGRTIPALGQHIA